MAVIFLSILIYWRYAVEIPMHTVDIVPAHYSSVFFFHFFSTAQQFYGNAIEFSSFFTYHLYEVKKVIIKSWAAWLN